MPFLINQRVKKLILTAGILILAIVPFFVVYASDIKNTYGTGLLEHWQLEETSGNRTGSLNSTVLTDVNTVGYATGKQGNGGDFERSASEYLTVATAVGSGVDDDLSFGFWIKPESIPDGVSSYLFSQLFSYQIVDGTNSYYASLLLFRYGAANTIQILLKGNTTTEDYYTHSLSAGTWYYIGFTVDKGTGYTLTINGSSVKTGTAPTKKTSSPPSGDSYLEIGESRDGTTRYGRYYDGLMDELSVWNTARSVADYSAIYNSGNGIPYDEGGGGSSYDNTTLELVFW